MATRFPSRSRPPVARAPAGNAMTGRDPAFSWVMAEKTYTMYQSSRGRHSDSLESLTDSAETHQSSSVASFDNDSPTVARTSPIQFSSPTKLNVSLPVSEPHIVDADPNPPLQAKKLKTPSKAVKAKKEAISSPAGSPGKTSPKSKSVASTKDSGKSLVPSAFKFMRSKAVPAPVNDTAPAGPTPAPGRRPSMRSSLPIAARFAKANRESWIQKYGSIEGTKGPIVPSSKPTLSFIRDLPEIAEIPPPVPALPDYARTALTTNTVTSPERVLSPVARARSPSPPSELPYMRSRAPLRVASPAPTMDLPPTPAATRIMYASTKPAPTTPLPQPPTAEVSTNVVVDVPGKASDGVGKTRIQRIAPPSLRTSPPSRSAGLPQLPRSTPVVQVSRKTPSPPPAGPTVQPAKPVRVGLPSSPLPASRFAAPSSGRGTPVAQVTRIEEPTQSRRGSLDRGADRVGGRATPLGGRTTPLNTSGRATPNFSPERLTVKPLNIKPQLQRLQVPNAGAAGLVTASAPTSPMQAEKEQRSFIPAPSAASGLRRTPSLPPAPRAQTPQPVTGARRGREHPFPLQPLQARQRPAPSAYAGSVTDDEDDKLARVGFYMSKASLSATDLTSTSLRPQVMDGFLRAPIIDQRISEARSSMYSTASADDSFDRLMSEAQHEARRGRLIDNVERLIVKDARVMI